MVNPIGHWFQVTFGTIFRITLMVLSDFRGTGFWIPLRGLSIFRITPGLVVTAVKNAAGSNYFLIFF